ncbi:translation initiation factor eIF-5 [Coniella lustricola]|uniref:Translation initiation factor eIF-5 n=1 Tax=Coniella lustricola TaxID=2025994 RepID=A0A2T3AB96_9PEZI|nr:translation initiation factor eIF-5 [Coniella lustricola]
MAALINVRRDVSDSFYRYKMERLQTKVEGKGNGIKTVITNLTSVAQSLDRPGAYLIKFFGFELGAQTNIDPKDDRWIINGAHESAKLQDLLDIFIKKFVLCQKCKNPETKVEIKNEIIELDCKACGVHSSVDLRHKLSGFIIKNQATSKKNKKDKAERKAARKAKQNGTANGKGSDDEDKSDNSADKENGDSGSANGDANGDIASDDDALTRRIKAEAQEIKNAATVKDDEWAVDMSEEAVKARQQNLPGEFKQKLNIGEDEDEDGEGGGNTVYDQLGDWIQEQTEEKGNVDNVDGVDIFVKAKELGIETKHRTVQVLVLTLFNDNILAQIPKRAALLAKIIGESERHQKALLGGTERFVGDRIKTNSEFPDKIVKVLMLYYQHDLASEEVLLKWGGKASKKYVDVSTSRKIRKAAEPFMKWLEEAEDDETDESDDE